MVALSTLLGRTFRGYTGSAGAAGVQGIQGIVGVQGLQGEQGTTVYDFGVVSIETPLGGSVLGKIVFPRAVTIPQNFVGSRGDVDTAPSTDPYVIDVTQNGVSVGTISIGANSDFDFVSSNSISVVEGVNVEKITAYLVLLDDTTGNARQISSELRPAYQDGAIPYIDFSGDKFLTTEITKAGIYTLIFYKPDNTFLVERKYLPEGRFAIPKVNFNQLYINRGRMKPSDIVTIQNQMLSRVNP